MNVFTMTDGNGEMKCRALTQCTFDLNSTAHRINNLLYQSQSHTCAEMGRFAFGLIKWFEDVGETFCRNTFARIGYIEQYTFTFAPYAEAHFAVLWRELQSVGDQIVQHLIHIVGHEIHHGVAFRDKLQIDATAVGIIAITLHYHSYLYGNVTATQIGIPYGRLHL